MRLFLDAHVSGRAIAGALRQRGHDVHAADEERGLDGWDDEALLALAASERRIMVTFNVRDFPRILGEWAGGGKHHAGCLLVVSDLVGGPAGGHSLSPAAFQEDGLLVARLALDGLVAGA